MSIKKLKIKNFKRFSGWFTIEFNEGTNILVGNNGEGKSTILEAINLVLTGTYRGKNIKNEISPYLFNKSVLNEYVQGMKSNIKMELPEIVIECYFNEEYPGLLGDGNSERSRDISGISLTIRFDQKYANEYALLSPNEINSIPIEYYEVRWQSFARENITLRSLPEKSALIDSTSYTPISGSDIYISRIIKNILEENEIVKIAQVHRIMKENFSKESVVMGINQKLEDIANEKVTISVDLGNKNSWESFLITELDDIPYNFIGKGKQSVIKTKLALSDEKIADKKIILLEEPECHLSHSNLNILLNTVNNSKQDKQIIITTHSSFVANKLGLEHLILINESKTLRLADLQIQTQNYFKKVSGYDTLRFLFSKKSILVEGPSDELIVQRAYMDFHGGKLPIQQGVDVISVGTSFLRFLEIAQLLQLNVSVLTDNDGNIEVLERKYSKYLEVNKKENINICYDQTVHNYNGKINEYNYNTIEPCILRSNSLDKMNRILNKTFSSEDELLQFMKNNKTEVALKIFESEEQIVYPDYIREAISL